MAFLAPSIEIDPNLEAVYNPKSPEYATYQKFVDTFGNDEFVFIAIKNNAKATDAGILTAVTSLTDDLRKMGKVTRVESVATLHFPGRKGDKSGIYPLVQPVDGQPVLDERNLERLRKEWPSINMFVSEELDTIGVTATIVDELTFGPWTKKLLNDMETAVRNRFPEDSQLHMVGMPVMKVALQKYIGETACTFGLLSALVATLISAYIFKRFWVMLAGAVVGGLSVLWIVGLMVLLQIRLNMSTSVCFGTVFILTIPPIIHIVSHFNKQYLTLGDTSESLKAALRLVGRPCFMCSLTTSIGFASIMLSPIPSISQMGLIISSGVLISFALTIILIPNILMHVSPLSGGDYFKMSRDYLSRFYGWLGEFVFKHGRRLLVLSLAFIGIMSTGLAFVKTDEPITHMLRDWTPEARDIRFVEKNLLPVTTVSIFVDGDDGTFKRTESWMKVKSLEDRLSELPAVHRTESLLPLMKTLNTFMCDTDSGDSALFRRTEAIPQLLAMSSCSTEASRSFAWYVNKKCNRMRLSVTLDIQPNAHLAAVIGEVEDLAKSELEGSGDVFVTGHLAIGAAQATNLIRTQMLSLLVALFVITLLITIQLRSFSLGLISIIPNAFPLLVIFGTMGWLKIYLDSLTIFVAVVSYGLSVDDTIHTLTQLQREMKHNGTSNSLVENMYRAYRITGKAIITTSAVLFFSFLVLFISPFQPVVSFGLLAALAVLTALIGDIVLLPSLVISSPYIRKVIRKGIPQTESTLRQ